MSTTKYTVRPRLGKISTAVGYSGRSRTRLYELAEQHKGLFKKDGASTLVDFDVLDEVIDQFPDAVINVSSTKAQVAEAATTVSDCELKEAPGPE